MLPALIAAVSVATTAGAAAPPPTPSATEAYTFATQLAHAGPRPAGGAAERRAHQRVASRFRAAGLRVGFERFAVPGKGTSRDVIGIRDIPARCLVIAMAHADTVPPAPGADDNASGVGTIVALAPALADGPGADVRHVARGDRLRGAALHQAARPPRRQQRWSGGSRGPTGSSDVRLALSLDEVGRGTRFELRSPVPRTRPTVEQPILDAARRANVNVTWLRDTATGNSDHRELALAGAPATKLGVPDEPFRHTASGHARPPSARRLRPRAARRVAAAARAQLSASIRSAKRSASAIVLRFVFARGIDGMTEASATDRPSQPCTRPSPSTTAPIAHVPTGWKKPAGGLAHVALGVDVGAGAQLARRVRTHLVGRRHRPQRLHAVDEDGDVALVGQEAVVDGQRRARVGRGQARPSRATTASSRRRRRCPA